MEHHDLLALQGKKAIGPSLLSADFTNLERAIEEISEMDYLHYDVIDGHFAPNLTFGPPILKHVRRLTDKPIDCHLMVTNPDELLEDFAKAGADHLTLHQEVLIHGHRSLMRVKELGMTAGIVLNPMTSLTTLEEYLPYVDLVLLMSVNPGFSGQSFIPTMLDKIRRLKDMVDQQDHPILIQVDGGVKPDNIEAISAAGCDLFVAGSGVFGAEDKNQRILELRQAATQAVQ